MMVWWDLLINWIDIRSTTCTLGTGSENGDRPHLLNVEICIVPYSISAIGFYVNPVTSVRGDAREGSIQCLLI